MQLFKGVLFPSGWKCKSRDTNPSSKSRRSWEVRKWRQKEVLWDMNMNIKDKESWVENEMKSWMMTKTEMKRLHIKLHDYYLTWQWHDDRLLFYVFMCACFHLDPLSLRGVGQLVHAALDVVQPGQQVMWLPPVLVPLGSDGQRLPVPQQTQVLHIHTYKYTHRSVSEYTVTCHETSLPSNLTFKHEV